MTLYIDIETYCELDLSEVGVYAYTEHPSFRVLMIAYAFDDSDIQMIDMAGKLHKPGEIFTRALTDPKITKSAFNANFERTCLAKHFGVDMPPEQWHCTMVHAMTLGLPRSLGKAAEVMGVSEKMKGGKRLITYFSKPCKPTKANGGRSRNMPYDDLEKWKQFRAYCIRDVEVEREIAVKLGPMPIHADEQSAWELDQRINDRGVMLDMPFVEAAVAMDARASDELQQELIELTGVDNPNSLQQLKDWLNPYVPDIDVHEMGLTKSSMPVIREVADAAGKRMIDLREKLGKSSTSKYTKMEQVVCGDGRARGMIQFYGASRTGRFSGRHIQVQNLPRNDYGPEELREARRIVREGDMQMIRTLYGDVADTLSQLIRTAFIPAPGNLFYVSDFSAIEARVIAWLAGEKWRLDVFNTHGKIYEASAAMMFDVPLESIDKDRENYHLRAQGKVAELACGYGGSIGAMRQMDFSGALTEADYKRIVNLWRKKSPRIVSMWCDLENAAVDTVRTGSINGCCGVTFYLRGGFLFCRLPSGRDLAYPKPKLKPGKFGNDQVHFMTYSQGRWREDSTYGGKLAENITQAVARDLLVHAMKNLENAGYPIVMHVHDEVVIEAPDTDPGATMAEIDKIMSSGPAWADGLPLGADGYTCDFYMKD